MQTIYKPKGKALEYADYSLNIYSGCSHGCAYCYMRPMHERFHGKGSFDTPEHRDGLLLALKDELKSGEYAGKLIHLCFSCDPYPAGTNTAPTREAIGLLKQAGCHVQILTKGGARAERDFDLLDDGDWFGITDSGDGSQEPDAASTFDRIDALYHAHLRKIKTWVSFEPVYNPQIVYRALEATSWVDLYRIGKLNYHPSTIDWKAFGHECERLAKLHGRNIYIKDGLREEMEK